RPCLRPSPALRARIAKGRLRLLLPRQRFQLYPSRTLHHRYGLLRFATWSIPCSSLRRSAKALPIGGTPTLGEIRGAVLKIRASKGMVIHPNDPDSRSAGSFFKNPVLSGEQFSELEQRTAARGLKIPRYPALSQQHKVPAAWLVENAGFHKGFSLGAVGISTKHTLAIVNRGGARASDIIALRDEIQSKVERTWG